MSVEDKIVGGMGTHPLPVEDEETQVTPIVVSGIESHDAPRSECVEHFVHLMISTTGVSLDVGGDPAKHLDVQRVLLDAIQFLNPRPRGG